nr:NS2 [Mute swan feces associated ambidensovirus 6]
MRLTNLFLLISWICWNNSLTNMTQNKETYSVKELMEEINDAVMELDPKCLGWWLMFHEFLEKCQYKIDQYPLLEDYITQQRFVLETLYQQREQNSDKSPTECLDSLKTQLNVILATSFDSQTKKKLQNFAVSFETMQCDTTPADFSSFVNTTNMFTSSTSAHSPDHIVGAPSSKKRKLNQTLENLIQEFEENTPTESIPKIVPTFSSISVVNKESKTTSSLSSTDEWKGNYVEIKFFRSKDICMIPPGPNNTRWKHVTKTIKLNYSPQSNVEKGLQKIEQLAFKEVSSLPAVEKKVSKIGFY